MKKLKGPSFYVFSKEKIITFACIAVATIAIIISFFVFLDNSDNSNDTTEEITEKGTLAPILYSPESPKSLEYSSLGDGSCTISGIGRYIGTELIIPSKSPAGETVVGIEAKAFENYTELVSVTIPATVTKIGEQAFKGCSSLVVISVDMSNTKYCSANGILYSKDKTRLIYCPPERVGNSYLLDYKVKSISDYAFFGVQNLNRVYYEGSTAEFESIRIGKGNEDFTSLPITCNYIPAK